MYRNFYKNLLSTSQNRLGIQPLHNIHQYGTLSLYVSTRYIKGNGQKLSVNPP